MPVAELFLSAFIAVLFDRLASPELREFATQMDLLSKLKKLENALRMIETLLIDAGEKQLTDMTVKLWLDDLQDLAYDVEDILEELAAEVYRHKFLASRRKFSIPARFTSLSPSAVTFKISMGSKIKYVTNRLDNFYMQREKLGLKAISGSTSIAAASERPPTTSVRTEPAIYGRNEDKAKIIEMILRDEPSYSNFRVIPIVGMGGIGKTTLAREVFHDEALKDFKPKAWVCVSDNFDVLRTSKEILQFINPSLFNPNNLESVQKELRR